MPVYLCASPGSGSGSMKSRLLSSADNIEVININCIPVNRNSVYIFIKNMANVSQALLAQLKSRNNYLIYEPLDFKWDSFASIDTYAKNILSICKHIDMVLCNNKYMLSLYRSISPQSKYVVNYHEYDMRYKPTSPVQKIFYIGNKKKCFLPREVINKYSIVQTNITNNLTGIHIDFVSKKSPHYYMHTSTKLATSLCHNAIFICNRIPVYVEILGDDYELYINDDLSNIDPIIKKAFCILNDKTMYKNYLEQMQKYRIQLSPETVRNNYKKIATEHNF